MCAGQASAYAVRPGPRESVDPYTYANCLIDGDLTRELTSLRDEETAIERILRWLTVCSSLVLCE